MAWWFFITSAGLAAEPACSGYVDLGRLVTSHPRWPEVLELDRLAQRWEALAQGLGVEPDAGHPPFGAGLLTAPKHARDFAGATSLVRRRSPDRAVTGGAGRVPAQSFGAGLLTALDAQIQALEVRLQHEAGRADFQRRMAQERQNRYAQVRARVDREQQEWRNLRRRWPQGLARQQGLRRLAYEAYRRARLREREDRPASWRWPFGAGLLTAPKHPTAGLLRAEQEQILAWQRTEADRRFGRWLRGQFRSLEQELTASRLRQQAALEQPQATRSFGAGLLTAPDERAGSHEALNRELVRLRSSGAGLLTAPPPEPPDLAAANRPLALADWQGLLAFRQGREATAQRETRQRVQQQAQALRQHSEQLRQALRTEVRHRALAWARDRGLTITFDQPAEAVPDLTDPCREQLWPIP